jgi:hypothetical protein
MRCRVISEAYSDVLDKNLPPSSSRAVPTKQQTPLLAEVIAGRCQNHAISTIVWAKCKFSLMLREAVHGGNKVL